MTKIQSKALGQHQITLDLQVTRHNLSWKSICLLRFIFTTLNAMTCDLSISSCALPGYKKFELKLLTGARTRGHNFRTLDVYNHHCATTSSTVTTDQRYVVRKKTKMSTCKRISKFLGLFLCCSKSAMKNIVILYFLFTYS